MSTNSNPLFSSFQYCVRKRIATWDYLRRAHIPRKSIQYLNVVKLIPDIFEAALEKNPVKVRKRCLHWFYLGLSLGAFLPGGNAVFEQPVSLNDSTAPTSSPSSGNAEKHVALIRALNALMTEYAYATSDRALQTMIRGKDGTSGTTGSEDDVNYKLVSDFQETGSYTYLQMPHLPFELDYVCVFVSFADIVTRLYAMFLDVTEAQCDQAFSDAFMKLDAHFQKFVATVTKDLGVIASAVLKQEFSELIPSSSGNRKEAEDDSGDDSD